MAFLAFEGLDGAGKSTLICRLEAHLKELGHHSHVTREPGGTILGDELRQLLLRTDGEAPVERCELLMYQAIRAQHVEKIIRPKLAQDHWVLCDRYYASSFAFQAGGRELSEEDVSWLNNYAVNGVEPDLWILLDLTVEEGERRMRQRASGGQNKDRFEQEDRDFHQRVRDGYLKVLHKNPQDWLVLSAELSRDTLLEKVLEALQERELL